MIQVDKQSPILRKTLLVGSNFFSVIGRDVSISFYAITFSDNYIHFIRTTYYHYYY